MRREEAYSKSFPRSLVVLNTLGMGCIPYSDFVRYIKDYRGKTKFEAVRFWKAKLLSAFRRVFRVRYVNPVELRMSDSHRVLRIIGKELLRLCSRYDQEVRQLRRHFITWYGFIVDGEETMAARIRPVLEIRDTELVEKGEKLLGYCRQLVALIEKLKNFESMQAILDDETETVDIDIPEIEADISKLSNLLAAEIEVDLKVLFSSPCSSR